MTAECLELEPQDFLRNGQLCWSIVRPKVSIWMDEWAFFEWVAVGIYIYTRVKMHARRPGGFLPNLCLYEYIDIY